MPDICGDNRFEIIADYKKRLIDGTNIQSSPEEMAVIDNILFRFWQMGWLDGSRWIPVTDETLPNEGKPVLVYDGDIHIAKLEKGISAEERERMKSGALPDPVETVWNLSAGYFQVHRSESIKQCDEDGNNEKPYCWHCHGGTLYGQNVKFWMPRPKPPKEADDAE